MESGWFPCRRTQTISRPGESAAQHAANADAGVRANDDDTTSGIHTHAIPADANGTTDGHEHGNAHGDVAAARDE